MCPATQLGTLQDGRKGFGLTHHRKRSACIAAGTCAGTAPSAFPVLPWPCKGAWREAGPLMALMA